MQVCEKVVLSIQWDESNKAFQQSHWRISTFLKTKFLHSIIKRANVAP